MLTNEQCVSVWVAYCSMNMATSCTSDALIALEQGVESADPELLLVSSELADAYEQLKQLHVRMWRLLDPEGVRV